MAKPVFGLQQSLDGYVDHMELGPPSPALSRHFIEQARGLTGVVYGRRMYEIMRYWDEDLPDWDAEVSVDPAVAALLARDIDNSSAIADGWYAQLTAYFSTRQHALIRAAT